MPDILNFSVMKNFQIIQKKLFEVCLLDDEDVLEARTITISSYGFHSVHKIALELKKPTEHIKQITYMMDIYTTD